MENELLEIGRFAVATGLSVPALRHYDEVGILTPAEVDPRTSYRRYRPDQVADARLICALRGVDLPIEEVRTVLGAQDERTVREVLLSHRGRLAERAERLEEMIATSETYLDRGVPSPPTTRPRVVQVVLSTRDRDESVDFYAAVFGLRFNPDIASFQLGAYNTDSFLLLTVENWFEPATPSCFGMSVDDIDTVHQRSLAAGAVEVQPPADFAWKPRSSIIDDPSGNRIQLTQG